MESAGAGMTVNIELPEDISEALRRHWGDLPRWTLETLAAEAYKNGALTESQIRRMLGFATRAEVHAFLKQSGVYLDYTAQDLDDDLEAHRKLGILPTR